MAILVTTSSAPAPGIAPRTTNCLWSEARRCGAAVLDQGTIAATNLGINLLLVHFATPREFGLYGLGYSAVMLTSGVTNALIFSQMSVILPGCAAHRARALLGGFHRLQRLFAVLGAVIALLGGALWLAMPQPQRGDTLFVFALSCAVAGWLPFEFRRRMAYLDHEPSLALRVSLTWAGITALGLVLASAVQMSALHAFALAMLGGAAGFASWLYSRGELDVIHSSDIRTAWTEAWSGGRWALLGMSASWLQTYGYAWLLGLIEGTTHVADANAARMLVMPPMVAITALGLTWLPRFSGLYAQGRPRAATRAAILIYGSVAAIVLVYFAMLWVARDWLIATVLHGGYGDIEPLLLAWGAVLLLVTARSALTLLMQAQRSFRALTLISIVTAVIGLSAGLALLPAFGSLGAVAAVALSELALVVGLLFAHRRSRDNAH